MLKLNKVRVTLMTGAVALLVALVSVTSAVDANAGGATVWDPIGCYVAPSQSGLPIGISGTGHLVGNPSGNYSGHCDFVVPAALIPAKAIKTTGWLCTGPFGSTLNSQTIVNTEGTGMFWCKYRQ